SDELSPALALMFGLGARRLGCARMVNALPDVADGSHSRSASLHLTPPIESPRISRFCVAQPAMTTGKQAITEAAESFARKLPRVETFDVTHCGIVEAFAKFSCSA